MLQLGTTPAVSFGANVTSATSAMLTFYVVEGEIPQPIGGTMDVLNDGRMLVIQPDSTPAIGGIGGAQCSFDLYSGVFKEVFTGP